MSAMQGFESRQMNRSVRYYGRTDAGGSWSAASSAVVYCTPFTVAARGLVTGATAYVRKGGTVGDLRFALFDDNSGAMGKLLSVSNPAATNALYFDTVNGTWHGQPLHAEVESGKPYWIGFVMYDPGDIEVAYDTGTSGDSRYFGTGNTWVSDGQHYTQTADTPRWSVYVTTVPV